MSSAPVLRWRHDNSNDPKAKSKTLSLDGKQIHCTERWLRWDTCTQNIYIYIHIHSMKTGVCIHHYSQESEVVLNSNLQNLGEKDNEFS